MREPKKQNFDKSGALTATDWDHDRGLAARAILDGIPLGRTMTKMERRAVAIAACQPTHHLTITSILSRDETLNRFDRLKRRMYRMRKRKGYKIHDWLYAGVCVSTKDGAAGYHLHLLLWDYIHEPVLKPMLDEIGLGFGKIKQIIASDDVDPFINALGVVGYVLGQQEPVFGTEKHHDNLARPKYGRGLLLPQGNTVQASHPKLFAALNVAKDSTVPDDQLYSRLP